MKGKSILLIIIMLFANLTIISAKIPYLINYQGRLMENGVPVNGSHNIVFRIYDAPTDGTLIWEGDVQTVQITNGLFSAYIGETTAVGSPIAFSNIDWGSGDKYLEIQIDTDTMQPRERLTSVAYALFAKDIEDNSVTSSKIVDNTISANDLSSDADSLSKVSGGNMVISGGNIGIGKIPGGYKLDVNGSVNATTYYGDGSNLTGLETIPSGIIVMWSGLITEIPAGWVLCDGNNGTPDLRDKFIVGAGSTYNVGDFGGSTSHTHSAGTYQINYTGSTRGWNAGRMTTNLDDDAVPRIGLKPIAVTGTSGSANHLPPYYALAYIMKL